MTSERWSCSKNIFLKVIQFSFRRPKIILLSTLLILFVSIPLLKGLWIDTDFVRLIDSGNPVFKTYIENKKLFGETAPLIIFFDAEKPEGVDWDSLIRDLSQSISSWDDVVYQSDPVSHFSRAEPAGMRLRAALLNSEGPAFQTFLSRFDRESIYRQVQRTRNRLITVSDPVLREQISMDVLNVIPLVRPFFDKRMTDELEKFRRMLVLQPEGATEDTAYCMELTSRVNRLCERVLDEKGLSGNITARLAGLHALTAQSAEVLKRDMMVITLVSALLLISVLSLTLRPFRIALICFIPLIISIIFMLLVARLFFNPVYFLTIGFAAIVLGLGLDIGLHLTGRLTAFMRKFSLEEAVCRAASECGPPVFIGIVSTSVAFAALLTTGKSGIMQFACLTIIGLLMTMGLTFLLFPALIRMLFSRGGTDLHKGKLRILPARFFNFLIRHKRIVFSAGLILILVSVPFAMKFSLDTRVENLYPKNLGVWETMEILEDRLNTAFTSAVQVSIDAPTIEEALAEQRRLDAVLTQAVDNGYLALIDSPASVFPYSVNPEVFKGAESKIKEQRDTFFAAMRENRLKIREKHRLYYDILERSARFPGNILNRSRQYPELMNYAAETDSGVRLQTYIWPSTTLTGNHSFSPRSADYVAGLLEPIHLPQNVKAAATSSADMLEKIQIQVKRDFFRISWLALALVILSVGLFFKRFKETVSALVPLSGAVILMLALIVILNVPVTPAAIAFGAIVFGIGIDDAVHILARVKQKKKDAGKVLTEIGPVITLTTISTAVGFGSLMLSSHPVVSSIGKAVSIGVLACWLFTVLLLPAIVTQGGKKIFKLGLIILIGLGSGGLGFGNEQKAEKILSKLRDKMQETEAVSCTFSQVKRIRQLEGNLNLNGTMLFQKPHFLKIEMRGDANVDIYVREQTVTLVDHDLEEIEHYHFDELARSEHWMSPMLIIFDMDEVEEMFELSMTGGSQKEILRMSPRKKYHHIQNIDMRIDEFQRIRWLRVRYENGDMTDTKFQDWEKRKRISEDQFRYSPKEKREKEKPK